MASSSTVREDLATVQRCIETYSKQIDSGLSGSWEGESYNKLVSEASAFCSDCSKIATGMNAFAYAWDVYEAYKENEARIKKARSEKASFLKEYPDGDASGYDNAIDSIENDNIEKAAIIEENLGTAMSSRIANATVIGLPGELGGKSGVLSNARIGEKGRPDPKTNMYFQNEANGGINGYPLNGGGPGVGGNCTYYAYSRFSELLGEEATGIADGDACTWYDGTTAYKKGLTPELGAIAVWRYGNSNSNGHVAVVEEIKPNGDIVVSEGGWSNGKWYGNNTYKKSNNYATGYNNGHLVGFIYPEKA